MFGLAIDAYCDTVDAVKTPDGKIQIVSDGGVPHDPRRNTAGLAVQAMQDRHGMGGAKISIRKGVPAGYGMGSSAASAAAAVVACDRLYDLGLDTDELVACAGYGENASAGTPHYDNVAASVCGGFVMVRDGPRVVGVPVPDSLIMCVATPRIRTPPQKSKVSRSVLPDSVPLGHVTHNVANAVSLAAGFFLDDTGLICDSINDCIVEPARRHMIPGFDDVKRMALDAGAMGFGISGAGPSVISFADDTVDMESVREAMVRGFGDVACDAVICRPAPGAEVTDNG